MSLDRSRRTKLKPASRHHFEGETLFARVARAVCDADCLPRKELYESWEVARRTRRRFRGGRVVDLACGHGLVAHLMLLLDDTSPSAVCVDRTIPPSAAALSAALIGHWPRLEGRVRYEEASLESIDLHAGDVVVSTHACGALTDLVLERAARVNARVVVLPCCHDEETCDPGGLEAWMDVSLAIDATRARRMVERGYSIATQTIPEGITPKNRILLATPGMPSPLDD